MNNIRSSILSMNKLNSLSQRIRHLSSKNDYFRLTRTVFVIQKSFFGSVFQKIDCVQVLKGEIQNIIQQRETIFLTRLSLESNIPSIELLQEKLQLQENIYVGEEYKQNNQTIEDIRQLYRQNFGDVKKDQIEQLINSLNLEFLNPFHVFTLLTLERHLEQYSSFDDFYIDIYRKLEEILKQDLKFAMYATLLFEEKPQPQLLDIISKCFDKAIQEPRPTTFEIVLMMNGCYQIYDAQKNYSHDEQKRIEMHIRYIDNLIQQNLENFSNFELINLMLILRTFDIPSKKFLCQQITEQKLLQFKIQNSFFPSLLNTLAQYDADNIEFQQLQEILVKKEILKSLNPVESIQVLMSFVYGQQGSMQFFQESINFILRHQLYHKTKDHYQCVLYQIIYSLQYLYQYDIKYYAETQQTLQTIYFNELQQKDPIKNSKISVEFQAFLDNLGVKFEKEIPCSIFLADYEIRGLKKKWIVEIYGRHHLRDQRNLNYATLWRERLIKKEGYNILAILSSEWERINQSADKKELIKQAFEIV